MSLRAALSVTLTRRSLPILYLISPFGDAVADTKELTVGVRLGNRAPRSLHQLGPRGGINRFGQFLSNPPDP